MPIVAEEYALVIGVDTHAATHSLALFTAATGGKVKNEVFPNSSAGLDRARSVDQDHRPDRPTLGADPRRARRVLRCGSG